MVLPVKRTFRHAFRPKRLVNYNPTRGMKKDAKAARKVRRQAARAAQEHIRRAHPGSNFPFSLSLCILLIVVRALREIKYYQSAAMDEMLMIPQAAFIRLVRDISRHICDERRLGEYRWERDALVALQTMSETILTIVFGLT
jgi:histone H3/H4